MGKNKHKRFQENLTFSNLVQPQFDEIFHKDHPLKGKWRDSHFGNPNPVVLELGCGRGEYTVALARMFPDKNFIGVDIKGARIWRGAKTATEENLGNASFLRTRIEFINSFFAPGEVDEIWITFPDPQLKKNRVKKRLTSPPFLSGYSAFLRRGAVIHLKTDSLHLHEYTKAVAVRNELPVEECCDNIYGQGLADEILSVKTAYEEKFLKEGLKITYIRFRLDGRDSFESPEFEEPGNSESGRELDTRLVADD